MSWGWCEGCRLSTRWSATRGSSIRAVRCRRCLGPVVARRAPGAQTTAGRVRVRCAVCQEPRVVHRAALRTEPAVLFGWPELVVLVQPGEFACGSHYPAQLEIDRTEDALRTGEYAHPLEARARLERLKEKAQALEAGAVQKLFVERGTL